MKTYKQKPLCPVKGFSYIGIHSGVKRKRKDLSMLYSKSPCVSAATFTRNHVKANCVKLSMDHIQNKSTHAIVINSGNANACTGERGYMDALNMAKVTACHLGISPKEVLVASTGIIGVDMPMDKIYKGINMACKQLNENDPLSAAEGILTTDTFAKTITIELKINNHPVTISGIAKGSGMIHPNMGTMLSFITTDINISKSILDIALKDSVEDTYNMVSVDGDTSTNDMVMILANGEAKNDKIYALDGDYMKFKEALDFVNQELAKMIAKDGEGATKLIETHVIGAKTKKDAQLCAKSVIGSSLVKSALFGSDANWGRILCAVGYGGGNFSPQHVDISLKSSIGEIQVAKNGMGIPFDENLAKNILSSSHVYICINLHDGIDEAIAWGCDLTYDYVKINGSYRT